MADRIFGSWWWAALMVLSLVVSGSGPSTRDEAPTWHTVSLASGFVCTAMALLTLLWFATFLWRAFRRPTE